MLAQIGNIIIFFLLQDIVYLPMYMKFRPDILDFFLICPKKI